MKKQFLLVLATVLCTCASVTAGTTAFAYENSVGTCPVEDVSEALTADNVSVTDLAGNNVSVAVAGPESDNVSYTKGAIVDGNESSWAGIAPVDGSGNKILGWFVLDLGKIYPVTKITMVMQHDWEGTDVVIQAAETADFSNAVTIYNNDSDNSLGQGAAFTADAAIPVQTYLKNYGNNGTGTDKNGNTWSFDCISARYVRVTNNQFGNAALQNYSACGEINVYAYAGSADPKATGEVTPVMSNIVSGNYADDMQLKLSSVYNTGEIYYTLDGSVPNDKATKYTAPVALSAGKTYKIRAAVKVNGVYSIPCDYVFSLDEAGKNVALNKSVSLVSLDGTTQLYAIDAGEAIADDKNMLVDGSYNVSGCFRTATYDEATKTYTQCVGWAVVDLGKVYSINKITYSTWQTWAFKRVIVQVSQSGDFSADAVTIYSNDDRKQVVDTGAYSIDASVSTDWQLSNGGAVGSDNEMNGNAWEFSAIKCRYIRVTSNANDPECSYFTELQAYAASSEAEEDYKYSQYVKAVKCNDELTVKTGFSESEIIAKLNESVTVTMADGSTRSANGSWTIENYDANAVKTYTATFVPAEPGDMYGFFNNLTIRLNVVKYFMTISISDKVYDGTPSAVNVECSDAGYTVSYYKGAQLLDSAPVNAGKYKVVVEIGENEEKVRKEATFTIEKADTNTIGITVADKTYDGEPVVAEVNASAEHVVKYYLDNVLLDGAPANAGTYKAVAEIAESENVVGKQAECTFTILKSNAAPLIVSVSDKTYDNFPAALTVTAESDYTVKYFEGETELTEAPVNAGNYKVVVSVPETTNYFGTSANKTFSIFKAEKTLTLVASDKVYDGKAAEVTVEDEEQYEVTWYNGETELETAPVDAGTYRAVVSVAQSRNYFAAIAEKEVVISKAEPNVSVTYVGAELVAGGALPTAEDFAVTGAKGTLTVSIEELKEGINEVRYTFTPEDAANYKTITGTVSIQVAAAKKSGCFGNVTSFAGLTGAILAVAGAAALLRKKKCMR